MSSRAPQRVLPDLIVPLSFFNNTTLYRMFVMFTIFVVPAQLDTNKLHDALQHVVSRPGWNKLTGRVQRNGGKLEYHIPQSFPEGRHVITHNPVDYSNIPLTDNPKIPKTVKDYFSLDESLLSHRTVLFKDCTIIAVYWPHVAFNAMALNSLLEAWSLALNSQDHEIPEALPLSPYPLEELSKTTKHRMVCMPSAFVEELKKKAEKDLKKLDYKTTAKKAEESSGNGTTAKIPVETPFLTKSDLLVTWLTRLFLLNSSENPKKLVCVQQAYNSRPILSNLLPTKKPFLSNCVGFLVTLMPISNVLTKSLGYLASEIRRSITKQRTPEQAEAYSSLVQQDHYFRSPPFFSNSSTRIHAQNEPLRPRYVQTVQKPYNFPNRIISIGINKKENFWLSGHKRKGE
ncbi:hypothetical protein LY78DRAFT_708060 [Colletotrichum sublineola]|nr:hypothetical protein LY78DRAFT_708060 [Colletotrichum sublineola]